MMDKKFLTILIIVAVLFLIIGGGLGIFYQKNAMPNVAQKFEAVNILSSKIVPSITAYGQVTNIIGRNITLTFGDDSLVVPIKSNAQIFIPKTSVSGGATTEQQTAKFEDIKKGQNLSINLKLLPDGQIEGTLVIILQPTQ